MRSLFGFLAFVTVLAALGAAFLVPPLVGPAVASAVRTASPFGQQPLDVVVDVDAIGLTRGFVREIHVSGKNLDRDGATIESLDVIVGGVGIGDHQFTETSGGLAGVRVSSEDGFVVTIDRVTLSGPSCALTAEAKLGRAAALAFPGDPWRLTGATISTNGMVIDASVDVDTVLGSG